LGNKKAFHTKGQIPPDCFDGIHKI